MDGIFYIFFGLSLVIIAIVFLFFKIFRKAGIVILILAIVIFFVGVDKCSHWNMYPQLDEENQTETYDADTTINP